MISLIRIIGQISSPATKNDSPLIAHGLQQEQYIGIVLIAIALVAVVGFFSRKFEYAIILSILLSVMMVGWLFAL